MLLLGFGEVTLCNCACWFFGFVMIQQPNLEISGRFFL